MVDVRAPTRVLSTFQARGIKFTSPTHSGMSWPVDLTEYIPDTPFQMRDSSMPTMDKTAVAGPNAEKDLCNKVKTAEKRRYLNRLLTCVLQHL